MPVLLVIGEILQRILANHATVVDQDLTTLARLVQEEITTNVPHAILAPSSIPTLEVSA